MTLSYAAIADGGIVLAADSQITYTHRVPEFESSRVVGTYKGLQSKIRRLGNHSAFSFAGNRGLVDTLLAKAELAGIDPTKSFEELVKLYGNVFCEVQVSERIQLPAIDAAFLFCGYIGRGKDRHPQIVKLDSRLGFSYNAITDQGFAFTGAAEHGGVLYLHHRFYRPRMPVEQAKLLVYCVVAEVAAQDNSVGGPIEMEIITPHGSEALSESDIARYEKVRRKLIATAAKTLSQFQ
jgi:20S proteasome alpha/beta subunit